jgi:hypothetical protein
MPVAREQPTQAGDVTQVLQDALLLHPPTENDSPTILSTNPLVWGGQHQAIDIGPLLGASATDPGRPQDVERDVAFAFQSAGWDQQRIMREFRPNLKSSERIDIALLGDDGQCLVAVEVKWNTSPNWPWRVSEARLLLGIVAPEVPWHCITDGSGYLLHNNATGARVELPHPFSPESLATGDFTRRPSGKGNVPISFLELGDLVMKARWVVLDHTIPAQRLGPQHPTKALLEEQLGRRLPPVVDLTQGMLAWLAQRENIAWLGGFGLAFILRGESSQWVRDQLGARFFVRSVIEFGGGLAEVPPSVRFCVFQLGCTPAPAFLAAVTGDPRRALAATVRAAKQFFAGEKPATGFTAEVQRTGRWAVSLYDPELNKLEQRLAGIGPTKPLSEVCEILRGFPPSAQGRNARQGVPIVTRAADLDAPESLPEDARRVALTPEIERYLFRPGDVVVPAIRGGAIRCVLVQSELQLVPSDHLFILRATEPTLTGEFLAEYLNSTLATRLIEERYSGSAGPILTARSLGSLPVPMLGRPVELDLREIGTLEAALRQRANELQLQRQTLFDATTAQGFASAVQELRRKGDVLSRSVLRADDLGFQVANFYPFPIAYGYRLLLARASLRISISCAISLTAPASISA